MMYYILCIISGFFNIFARSIYYDAIFGRQQGFKSFLFWTSSGISELILFANTIVMAGDYSFKKGIIIISVNLIINLSLTMFYTDHRFSFRFIMAISMEAINIISELGAASIFSIIWPDVFNSSGLAQDSCVTVFACILSFIIIVIISSLWKNRNKTISLKHVLLSSVTPFCSAFIIILIPHDVLVIDKYSNHLFFIFQLILIMNIINYITINDILTQSRLKHEVLAQSQQLQFQSEKYAQISYAYRDTRRIVHEFKRFISYITACAEKKDYESILKFLNDSSNDIEKRFVKANTGNLVIDTFMSNLYSTANELGIECSTEIRVDKDEIPIEDYDLCIVLGNLVDNCINSCRTQIHGGYPADMTFIHFEIFTKANFFVIHEINSTISDSSDKKKKEELYHGFGLSNAKDTTEKYNGAYFSKENPGTFETTVSIPILRDADSNVKHPENTGLLVPPPKKLRIREP